MPESPSEDTAQAVRAAKEWIEVSRELGCYAPLLRRHFVTAAAAAPSQAVTGRRFPADRSFRAGLEDGVLLCE